MINTLQTTVVAFVAVAVAASTTLAQEPGVVRGTVRAADDGRPLAGVVVTVKETRVQSMTGEDGAYVLREVPPGNRVIVMQWLGYRPREDTLTVAPGGTVVHDVSMAVRPILLSAIVVEGASRIPERIVEAPAAAAAVPPASVQDAGLTGQPARALLDVPGVDVVQNGMYDFNVSARGFNSTLGRRVLVLQDGRDVALGVLGIPYWPGVNTLQGTTIEVVRGPGSALFGANAYLGVVNYKSPLVRDAVGTTATVSGGELGTLRADVHQAAVSRDGRLGYRVTTGLGRSRFWDRSRTALDGGDLRREYADATDDPIEDWRDPVPLFGQVVDPSTGAAIGDPDPVSFIHAGARMDYYLPSGSVVTLEGAEHYLTRQVYAAGRNRTQIGGLHRPWARVAWSAERFTVGAWWAGFNTAEPMRSLLAGTTYEYRENVFHGEGLVNTSVLRGRGRFVAGTSFRTMLMDTRRTVLGSNDDRRDALYALFGQLDYQVSAGIRLVGALRWDDANFSSVSFLRERQWC